MVSIKKMFDCFFTKEKKKKHITFSEDFKCGYNSAWTNNIKYYWP